MSDDKRRSAPRGDGERRPSPRRDGERRPFVKRDGERRDDAPRSAPKRDAGNRSERTEAERPDWQKRVAQPLNPNKAKSPLIPDEITAEELPLQVRVQLKTLTEENAERVARHLAMVSLLIEQDPELAQAHAMAAVARAARIALVHEFAGAAAYANGDFAVALREMQTHRRISGSNDQIAIIVDCLRGLEKPDKALAEGRAVDRRKISAESRVNLAIAMSGARLDKGDQAGALAELEISELNPAKVYEYSAPLFYAYAECLEGLGRNADAKKWNSLGKRAEKEFAPSVGDELELIEEIEIPVRRERVEGEEEFERKPRFDRADGERKPRVPREGGERRSFVDRKPRSADGERKSFGDRKPRSADGERKTFGERGGRPAAGGRGPRRDDGKRNFGKRGEK